MTSFLLLESDETYGAAKAVAGLYSTDSNQICRLRCRDQVIRRLQQTPVDLDVVEGLPQLLTPEPVAATGQETAIGRVTVAVHVSTTSRIARSEACSREQTPDQATDDLNQRRVELDAIGSQDVQMARRCCYYLVSLTSRLR